jgi:protein NrfD
MTTRKTIGRVLLLLWVGALIAGLVGLGLRLFVGERLADYGSYIPWGLWIAVYAFLVGISLGAYLLFAAGQVFRIERLQRVARPALLISLAGIVSGLIVVGLDLGRVFRIWRVYAFPNPSSLMAWEIWLFTAFIVILLVAIRVAFRADLAAQADRPGARGRVARALLLGRPHGDVASEAAWLRALALVGGIVAVIVLGANGALFGVAGARPFWHSGLIPLLFLSAALLAGAAALTVYTALAGPRDERWAGQVRWLAGLTAVLLAIDLVIEWADVSIAFYSQPAAWDAYRLVLTGSYWWVFWIVHLLLGVAVPVAILATRGRRPMWAALAAGMILVTLVSVRLNIVIPGLAVPQIEGLDTAFVEPRLGFAYFPSAMEWLVTLLAAALATGIVWIGARLLPMAGVAAPEGAPGGMPASVPVAAGSTRGEFVRRSAIAGGALVA